MASKSRRSNTAKVQHVQGLRRSNAAGRHKDKRTTTRGAAKRQALKEYA